MIRHFINIILTIIACVATTSTSLGTVTFTSESRLNNGKWIKIEVANRGICKITYDQLSEMGFSNPSEVAVFGRGGMPTDGEFTDTEGNQEYIDDIPPVSTMHRDNAIYFFASGTSSIELTDRGINRKARNVYSDHAFYFLTESNPDAHIMTTATDDGRVYGNDNYDTAIGYQIIEEDHINPLSSSEEYFGWDIAQYPSRSKSFTYNIPGAISGSNMTLAIRGAAKISGPEKMYINITANGTSTPAGEIKFYSTTLEGGFYEYSGTDGEIAYISTSVPAATGSIDISLEPTVRSTFAAIDYIAVGAERSLKFQPDESYYELFIPNYTSAKGRLAIGSAPKDLLVWDMSNGCNNAAILPYTVKNGTALVSGLSEKIEESSFVAFAASAPWQSIVGYTMIENQNLHALSAETPATMLIITTNELKPSAEKLAQLHETYRNEKVIVATSQQIINEFSQGTPDPMAYRALARMLYDADKGESRTFANLLLLGPMRSDNRGITIPLPASEQLLCKQSEIGKSQTTSFTTLDFYGQMKDYYGSDLSGMNYYRRGQELAVAVLPINTNSEAELYIEKVASWLTDDTVPYWLDDIIHTADGTNENEHQKDSELMSKSWIAANSSFTHNKLYNNCYSANEIHSAFVKMLDRGSNWITYLGHASQQGLNTLLWKKGDHTKLRNKHLPFIMFGGCTITAFERGDRGSGEEMILSTPYGAIGALISNRTSLSSSNRILMTDIIYSSLCQQPFGLGGSKALLQSPRTLGETVRMAMDVNSRGNSNKLSYVLMCDPALPTLMPTASINIKINGQDDTDHTALPGSKMAVIAEIVDRENKKIVDFNGTAVFKLYGTPYTAMTRKEGDSAPIEITHDNRLLITIPMDIVDGTIYGIIPLPANIGAEGDMITMRMAALDNKSRRTALNDISLRVLPFSSEESEDDTEAPVIEHFYAGQADFHSGDVVNPESFLHAVITDNTAICLGSFNGNEEFSLTIDNSRIITDAIQYSTFSDGGRTMFFDYPLNDIAQGKHTATIKAADPSGNVSTSTIQFNIHELQPKATTITTDSSLVRDYALLQITTDSDAGYTIKEATLLIVDELGNIVKSQVAEGTETEWDVTDNDNTRVEPGTYYAVCRYITTSGTSGVTKPTRLIVIRPANK